jgi:hypothetical protein
MKKDKCWNCNKHPIEIKDYRWYDNQGKILSCRYCAGLNDVWHDRVNQQKLDPKKVAE